MAVKTYRFSGSTISSTSSTNKVALRLPDGTQVVSNSYTFNDDGLLYLDFWSDRTFALDANGEPNCFLNGANAMGYPMNKQFELIDGIPKVSVKGFDNYSNINLTVNSIPKPTILKMGNDVLGLLEPFNGVLKNQHDETIEQGSDIQEGDVLTLTLDGWELYKESNNKNSALIKTVSIAGYIIDWYFEDTEQDESTSIRVYTLTIPNLNIFNSNSSPRFHINATQVQTETIIGDAHVYKIDEDTLRAINAERFSNIINQDGVLRVDYGVFILGMINIPFKIDEDYFLEPEDIILGDKVLDVQGNAVSTDKITIDLGEISVPKVYNNTLDYQTVVCKLNLPYLNPIIIENQYVVGETISIQYVVEVYTGNADVIIHSTATDETILMQAVKLGFEVPYSSDNVDSFSVSNLNVAIGGDNKVLTPFIEILSYDINLVDGMFSIPVLDEGTLEIETGYFEVTNIDLNVKATGQEEQQIINAVRTGIIIK